MSDELTVYDNNLIDGEEYPQFAAFNCYYQVRKLTKVAKITNHAYTTIWDWYNKFRWEERARARDEEMAKKLRMLTDVDILEKAKKFSDEVTSILELIKTPIAVLIEQYRNNQITPFQITNIDDFKTFVDTYTKLIDTDLKLATFGQKNVEPEGTIEVKQSITATGVKLEKVLRVAEAIKRGDLALRDAGLTEIKIEDSE